ncbi:MAG: protein jag [Clostridia bacterium]|nr:protein jag [Clostridia bacterium]
MNKMIEKTGATIDEAVEKALNELNCTRDEVEIEVVNKGSKGIFGIGASEAKVIVKLLDEFDFDLSSIDTESNIETYLLNILEKMGIEANLDVKENEGNLDIEISGDMMGVVIGRRGDTLDALQYLCSLVYNKNRDDYVRVNLDTENYRAKREETLVNLAKKIAGTVSRTGRSITLEPMNPNERRIIHSTLQSYDYINTYSIGEDPNRKIVVSSKNSSRAARGGYRRNYSSYKKEEIATEE